MMDEMEQNERSTEDAITAEELAELMQEVEILLAAHGM